MPHHHEELLRQAAIEIAAADALLIGAGAGMGVDSGLPDFRGTKGFWKAYPLYGQTHLDFASMANPRWFAVDPTFAWGFYGHRLTLYRTTDPHDGFRLLLSWSARMPHGAFVYTSNVDGQFQRAGFGEERVYEVHGSIHHLQCTAECGTGLFPADPFEVAVDEETLRARPPLPTCPECEALARPNVLMFGDWAWDPYRSTVQQTALDEWLDELAGARLAVVECGAGTAIPTVRNFCQRAAATRGSRLIRINPREPEVSEGHIGLAMGALEALVSIDGLLAELWGDTAP
jgi:NAD-dependent SIR2 family protein deacetylase